ncbi:MAG: AraC family transcriptional regulator [Pseudomonadales bacterium]|nr:AraC family transcriptional regulator [Pseudomonadales bacterium]NRA18396.1 helix-turn-helix transcriptional regulator [Oceanospirillaceae bacterium]
MNDSQKSQAKLCLKSYQPQVDTHQHEFHQLVLPVQGSLQIEIGTKAGTVQAQHAAVICASESHAFEARGDNQFIVADIPLQLAPAFEQLPVFIQLDENINRYIHFLQAQLSLDPSQQNPLMQRQMLLLLVQLLDDRYTKTQHFDKRLLVARHFLEQHFASSDVINNAARVAALSSRHLRQLFKLHYQMPPSQYLLELRMQSAWQMLAHSTASVQIVAERCGYSSLSAFSDRFHKHFAHSPMQIRRTTQQQNV